MAKDKEPKDARLGGKRRKSILPPVKEKPKAGGLGGTLFNLFILAFIGYGFYSYMQKGGDVGIFNELGDHLDIINQAPEAGDPRLDRLQKNQPLSVLGNFTPVERVDVATQTLQQGAGLPVICGQTVTYRLITGFGEKREVSEKQTLKLGDPQKPLGLTRGMVGMKLGEVRQLKIPQQLWTGIAPREGQPAEITSVNVEMLTASPAIPEAQMPLRRFVVKGSSGAPLQCGDIAMLHLIIWNGKGEQIFSTKETQPVAFYLGENTVPYGLERGVEDMLPGGEYTLAIAPELWKPLEANAKASPLPKGYAVQPFPQDVVWPHGEMLLVDIYYPREVAKTNAQALPVATPPVRETPELSAPAEVIADPVIEKNP